MKLKLRGAVCATKKRKTTYKINNSLFIRYVGGINTLTFAG